MNRFVKFLDNILTYIWLGFWQGVGWAVAIWVAYALTGPWW